MASPPWLFRLRPLIARPRLAVTALAGAVGLALLVSTVVPATARETPNGSITPAPRASASAATATSADTGTKPKKPVPASRTTKARHIPAFPRDHKHHGKRIVYDKALMTVWLVNAKDEVVGQFPVVGRFDRPAKGTYHIFSKSPKAYNPNSKVTFNWMNRFTYGPDTHSAIGFHAIPRYYDGTPMHSTKQLGLAIARGGCVRLSEKAAKQVYDFLKVGTLVVVLPSP